MTTAWSPIVLTGVAAAGVLTQLYPPSCTPGSGATASGTERRQPQAGILFRVDMQSDPANDGGILEVWDLAGTSYPQDPAYAANNIDTATPPTITNAYLLAQVAAGRAKLLWTQKFSGDPSTYGRPYECRTQFASGLAARFVGAGTLTLSVVADGGFRKIPIVG